MDISERIKILRKEKLHITQEQFGKPLGLTRANIANIEVGRISVTERVILGICEKFNVNEDWLRNGNGEIFITKTKNQIITDFAGELIKEDNTFKKRLFEALANLDKDDWEVIEKIADKFINKKE